MDNTPSECSAVRCRVFKGLRETTDRAWEADAQALFLDNTAVTNRLNYRGNQTDAVISSAQLI